MHDRNRNKKQTKKAEIVHFKDVVSIQLLSGFSFFQVGYSYITGIIGKYKLSRLKGPSRVKLKGNASKIKLPFIFTFLFKCFFKFFLKN